MDQETINQLPTVFIHCDGACTGNPGPGGWAATLRFNQHEKSLSGFSPMTTNNRMELLAAIHALETLKKSCNITLTSDSIYLKHGITNWIHQWKKRNWRKSDGAPVANVELWQRLEAVSVYHRIDWQWVKGHAGHPENEAVDRLARQAIKQGLQGELQPDPAD